MDDNIRNATGWKYREKHRSHLRRSEKTNFTGTSVPDQRKFLMQQEKKEKYYLQRAKVRLTANLTEITETRRQGIIYSKSYRKQLST